jgi:16S rRNA (guanine966-N2)-methyltransferase
MHIITGSLRGRIIKRPKHIRPIQDKVRKALFDILGNIKDSSFLDLYAGSGAVGLEALSQGVSRAVFVERDKTCIKAIKENLEAFGLATERVGQALRYQVIGSDVSAALKELDKRGEKFEVIFLDPPYYRDIAKKTLKIISRYDILTRSGFVICQHFKKDILPEVTDGLRLVRQLEYGDTILSFYKREL